MTKRQPINCDLGTTYHFEKKEDNVLSYDIKLTELRFKISKFINIYNLKNNSKFFKKYFLRIGKQNKIDFIFKNLEFYDLLELLIKNKNIFKNFVYKEFFNIFSKENIEFMKCYLFEKYQIFCDIYFFDKLKKYNYVVKFKHFNKLHVNTCFKILKFYKLNNNYKSFKIVESKCCYKSYSNPELVFLKNEMEYSELCALNHIIKS